MMFSSSQKTFYDAMKPLVFLNCHAGIGVYRRPDQTDVSYIFMQVYAVLVTLVNWMAIYYSLTSAIRDSGFYNASPMAIIMYKTIICTNACITVIAPFIVRIQCRGLRSCLRQMPILDETFGTILGARNEYRKEYIRQICHAVTVFLPMGVVGIYDTVLHSMRENSVLRIISFAATLHHPIIVMLILDLNFYSFLGYLVKKFRALNEALLRLAEIPHNSTSCSAEILFEIRQNGRRKIPMGDNRMKNTDTESLANDKQRMLCEIRKAHLDLCTLSREINDVFGIQNLLSSGLSFVMLTGLFYTIYSAFSWETLATIGFKEIVPSIMWAAIYAFKIWMINHACWNVSNEAQKTGEVIYEFLKFNSHRELGKNQIQEFSLQILQNPVSFNACGFFTLDYSFVQCVIGSITTYLVILIQMSHLVNRNATS